MGALRALTFDVYATLLDQKKMWSDVARRILTKYGSSADANEFAAVWKSITYGLGLRNFEKYTILLPKGLADTFRHYSIHGDTSDAKLLLLDWAKIKPFPEVTPALAELEKHFALGLISNTDNELLRKVVKQLAVKFDVSVTSEMAKAYKPASILYQTALERLRCQPYQVMHVAGSPYDVSKAKSLGMKAAWINRRDQKFQEEFAPDYELADLSMLPKLLLG